MPPIVLDAKFKTALVKMFCGDPRCRCAGSFVASARSAEAAHDALRGHAHYSMVMLLDNAG